MEWNAYVNKAKNINKDSTIIYTPLWYDIQIHINNNTIQ